LIVYIHNNISFQLVAVCGVAISLNQLFKCDLSPYEIKVKDLKVRYIYYLHYIMQLIKMQVYMMWT